MPRFEKEAIGISEMAHWLRAGVGRDPRSQELFSVSELRNSVTDSGQYTTFFICLLDPTCSRGVE